MIENIKITTEKIFENLVIHKKTVLKKLMYLTFFPKIDFFNTLGQYNFTIFK